ncbi:TatD family hydrolase [Marinimicrobium sp. ABcell2]|uniref:TatD family hydrolase n=1 Tax=Marinimicrobium sp. ABcell2 TaxID=3069751 RepID=UPI0027B39B22|nr:TatD family hydrolase [Marinimicrobium sp. ABcell2]MDQ2075991.1 TatD family hydrolase [Marinimicrobium sp. ABcell2]
MSAIPLIDIGANLTNRRFATDLDEVMARAREAGVAHIVITGTSENASRDALQLAQQHPGFMSATAGVHPHDARHWHSESADRLAELLSEPEVVAVGECGLDFNRDFSPRDQQLTCFEAQLQLAVELQKPVFLHQRDAHAAFLALLKKYRSQLKGAVVHCFTGATNELREYLELDCHIGITGWLCDPKRGADLRVQVRDIPVDRLMIETDAPYLTPKNLTQKPKNNRNEPALLPVVLEALAECRGESVEVLAEHTVRTSRAFFGLGN